MAPIGTHVIFGAGAVGSALAAQFTAAGLPNLLVARGAQLEHLSRHGLRYHRPEGIRQVALAVTDIASLRLGPADVLWLAVKAQDVEALSAEIAQIPGARDLTLVTLQNGLEAERIAARRFAHVYAAVVRTPAIYTRTGEVRVLAAPEFAAVTLGRFPAGQDAVSARLTADLSRAGTRVEERADIRRWKAQKLIYNVRNVVELFAGPAEAAARAGDALSAEAAAILRAAGHDPAAEEERRVSLAGWTVARDPAEPGGQSTWQSFVRGSRHEVDFLNGEIVLQARLLGRQAPWNAAAQSLAHDLAQRGGKPGEIGLERLFALAEAGQPQATAAR